MFGHGPKGRLSAAPTHALQPGPTSTSRPTSLIRGIRGQTRCDDQIDEASQQRLPQCGSQRHHPNQPGRQCNPRTPNPKWISGTGAAYMGG